MMGIPGVFVAGQPIPEAHFAGESGLAKQLHGPVDRGLPEGRVFTVNPIIDFFGGKMPVFIEEDLHDPLTLRRIAQSLGFQEMTEDVDRIGHRTVFAEHAPPRVGFKGGAHYSPVPGPPQREGLSPERRALHAPHEALASAIAEMPMIPSAHAPYGTLASSIPETPTGKPASRIGFPRTSRWVRGPVG